MNDLWWCILNDYDSGKCQRPSAIVAFCIISGLLLIAIIVTIKDRHEKLTIDIFVVIAILGAIDYGAWLAAFG